MSERETQARIAAVLVVHPELVQLAREVDRSLIRWSLSLTPMQRLRSATKHLQGLRKFRRVPPDGS